MLYILERLLSGDWIREGQDRTKVTSESIAIVNERRDRGLTLVMTVRMKRSGHLRFIGGRNDRF